MKARISGDSGMKGIRGVAWLAAAVAVQGAGAQAEPVSETVFQYRAWEVQAVAFDLGYESASAFITMFKKALGQPPAQYLANRQNRIAKRPNALSTG